MKQSKKEAVNDNYSKHRFLTEGKKKNLQKKIKAHKPSAYLYEMLRYNLNDFPEKVHKGINVIEMYVIKSYLSYQSINDP